MMLRSDRKQVTIPEALWEAAKAKAEARGRTVTDPIIWALINYVGPCRTCKRTWDDLVHTDNRIAGFHPFELDEAGLPRTPGQPDRLPVAVHRPCWRVGPARAAVDHVDGPGVPVRSESPMTDEEECGAESQDGWTCTRPKGHEPPHTALESRASGNPGVVLAEWEDTTARKEKK